MVFTAAGPFFMPISTWPTADDVDLDKRLIYVRAKVNKAGNGRAFLLFILHGPELWVGCRKTNQEVRRRRSKRSETWLRIEVIG